MNGCREGSSSGSGPGARRSSSVAKKTLMLSVVAFAAFFLLTRPVGAADGVEATAGAITEGFEQVARFLGRLIT